MNLTLAHKPPLTMDSPALFISSYEISYMELIIYGSFAIVVFIGICIAIITFRRGG